MVSDSPPERDMEWNISGVEGSFKFLNRLIRMVEETETPKEIVNLDSVDKNTVPLIKIHQTINDVTEGIEKFNFNVCIAKLYELTNSLSRLNVKNNIDLNIRFFGLKILSQLLSPFAPHHAEEIWSMLKQKDLVCNIKWPKANKKFLDTDQVTIGVQINGKLRSKITYDKTLSSKEVENLALSLDIVKKYLNNGVPKRIIFIPERIVNIVI